MDSSECVTLICPVETLSKRYRPGHQFHVRSWWESPVGRVADLVDAAGVLRVIHCPVDRFVSVSEDVASVAEFSVSGSIPQETIVDRATPEPASLPGTVEECPFEIGGPGSMEPAGQRRQIERLEVASPEPAMDYFRDDRLEFHNSTRWPMSDEHPRRGEWGAEWRLAPACVSAGERLICFATRLDRPQPVDISQAKYSGPEWRFWIDLNHGEFREWDGPWQSNESSVSESEASDADSEASDSHLVESLPEVAAPAVTPRPQAQAPAGPGAPGVCQFGEYPEPSADWTVDQLRGWRYVIGSDGKKCARFGPDAPEQKHEWAAWLVRVQEFEKGLKS